MRIISVFAAGALALPAIAPAQVPGGGAGGTLRGPAGTPLRQTPGSAGAAVNGTVQTDDLHRTADTASATADCAQRDADRAKARADRAAAKAARKARSTTQSAEVNGGARAGAVVSDTSVGASGSVAAFGSATPRSAISPV